MLNQSVTATSVPPELLKKYDRPGPRYTSYPTAPMWSEEVGPSAYCAALEAAASDVDSPLAAYVHIPFCRKRCFYCGCNTCVTNKPASLDNYIESLGTEIDRVADLLGGRRRISQLHFGGGTPTFLSISQLAHILDRFDKHFTYLPGCEKSIEIDPRVTTPEQLDFLAGRGFNRTSLGVQDLDSQVQQAIGRVQPEKLVIDVLEQSRRLNFRGINFDLIYGLPLQTVDSFTSTIDRVIALRPDRLAVYSFAYLPSLKAHQTKIRQEDLPFTETKYRLFAAAVEKFTAAGYRQIGMDHFALPEDELSLAQADGRLNRNFMGYTVQTAPEMIGFGMSSIGYVNQSFFQNISRITSYHNAVADSGLAVYRGLKLSRDDLIRQYVITSLMCNFRLDFEQLQHRFDSCYHDLFKTEDQQLGSFVADGLLRQHKDRLEITPVGRTFVRNIAMSFDAYLQGKNQGQQKTFSRTI